MERVTTELKDQVEKVLDASLDERTAASLKKHVSAICYEIEEDVVYRLKDELAPILSGYVEDMASRTVNAILQGNESEMRRYLGCERGSYTGRSDSPYRDREAERQHPVIHGKLFETGALQLRHEIAAACRDLITSERIADLEDQVASLVAQVNKANAGREDLLERLRNA